MIQINAGSFSYRRLGSMPPLGDAYGNGKGPGRRLSRAGACPTSTFGGSRSGAMGKQPLEHSSSSARQSIRVLRASCWSRTRRTRASSLLRKA